MNGERELFKIKVDKSGFVARWVCAGLGETPDWLDDYLALGFWLGDRLIGGLIFHTCRPNHDVWWTIYTTDKRWCNRRMLRIAFHIAFDVLKCRRVSLLVSTDNTACLRFVRKLGFQIEGCLRQFREDGRDCYLLGLLKADRPF